MKRGTQAARIQEWMMHVVGEGSGMRGRSSDDDDDDDDDQSS